MKIIATPIADLYLIEPSVFRDERGYFSETFKANALESLAIAYHFVQDNEAQSSYGVLRGLHYQKGSFAQAKLVRALQGEILDVAVDLRKDSPTFGQHFSAVLSAENKMQLLVPRGFAHGYSVLSPTATVFYKVDNHYAPQHEAGLIYNDPALAIDWKLNAEDVILSAKDQLLPILSQITPEIV